jgi:hypothetical protein
MRGRTSHATASTSKQHTCRHDKVSPSKSSTEESGPEPPDPPPPGDNNQGNNDEEQPDVNNSGGGGGDGDSDDDDDDDNGGVGGDGSSGGGSGGDNGGGGGGGGGDGSGGGNPGHENPPLDTNILLAEALTNLNKGIHRLCPSSTKVKDPDSFDGSNPQKLRKFPVACNLVFLDHPDSFWRDEKKVRYTISYLKGAALDWFEPIIMGELEEVPDWLHNYPAFVQELMDHFGPYDFRGDAETSLSNLTMKDSHRIICYTVEFNKLAARTDWMNEPALQDQFFRGLPLRLCTDILRGGKPTSLSKMRLKAQKYNQAYWLMKDEAAKSAPLSTYTPRDKDKSLAPSDKSHSIHPPASPLLVLTLVRMLLPPRPSLVLPALTRRTCPISLAGMGSCGLTNKNVTWRRTSVCIVVQVVTQPRTAARPLLPRAAPHSQSHLPPHSPLQILWTRKNSLRLS